MATIWFRIIHAKGPGFDSWLFNFKNLNINEYFQSTAPILFSSNN